MTRPVAVSSMMKRIRFETEKLNCGSRKPAAVSKPRSRPTRSFMLVANAGAALVRKNESGRKVMFVCNGTTKLVFAGSRRLA